MTTLVTVAPGLVRVDHDDLLLGAIHQVDERRKGGPLLQLEGQVDRSVKGHREIPVLAPGEGDDPPPLGQVMEEHPLGQVLRDSRQPDLDEGVLNCPAKNKGTPHF
jgi:hypothetical protein